MASEVEEYQEIVDAYMSAPEQGYVAPARQLHTIEYGRQHVKVHREDVQSFNNFVNGVNITTMEKISTVMSDTINHKLVGINEEVTKIEKLNAEQKGIKLERLKDLYIKNREKMKESKKVLKKSLKEVQQEELKRGQQLVKFINHIGDRELQAICFRCMVLHRNIAKFRRTIIDFCSKYRKQRLIDKTFHTWKHMVTQFGIELKLKKKYEQDLNAYKEEFLGVIALLQENIKNVEDQIVKKRESRKEFSYNLSRNLLKTISNLSMEVVSLNQYAIKDKEITNELESINVQVKERMKKLEGLKIEVTLEEEEEKRESQNKSGLFSNDVTKSSFLKG